jgi:hypothetical protein
LQKKDGIWSTESFHLKISRKEHVMLASGADRWFAIISREQGKAIAQFSEI